ncbi:hypothetical protein MHUMG1_10373 [Metarhizium humberi]|uniref:Uncharacterized protein n=1 Tax=Metarhizium humberi TaxID=2596975 RepID=A0A9P8M162_9HYPO|nr:hypothetical protein MHUMG1_10373 [Metarhizium humberi]
MEQLSVLLVAYSLTAEKPNGCTEQPRDVTYKTAYYQPTPAPSFPFEHAVGVFDSDPGYSWEAGDADGCDASWSVTMTNCQSVHPSEQITSIGAKNMIVSTEQQWNINHIKGKPSS